MITVAETCTAAGLPHRLRRFGAAVILGGLLSAPPASAQLPDSVMWDLDHNVIDPPADRALWPEARKQLIEWRTQALKTFSSAHYLKPGYEWAPSCYSMCFSIIHDSQFYNQQTHEYDVDGLLEYYEREYGGIDAITLWQLSPQIGFDDRNQFDFFRNMPGGLQGLRQVVARFHARGVKFLINHNPWNLSRFTADDNLRPESPDDPSGGPQAIAGIVRAIDADGVFLNTYAYGGEALQAELDRIRPGLVMEGEAGLGYTGQPPVDPRFQLAHQHMNWFQSQWRRSGYSTRYTRAQEWFHPAGIIRNKWVERRHMTHQIQRQLEDKSAALQWAWMNGSGVVIWENVFGVWRGWNERDRSTLRSMRPIQQRYTGLFSGEGWTPWVPALHAEIYAHLWEKPGVRLWTVVNNTDTLIRGDLLAVDHNPGDRYYDLIAGREIPVPAGAPSRVTLGSAVNARGIGAFLAAPADKLGDDFPAFLARQAAIKARENLSAEYPALPATLKPVTSTKKYPPDGIPEHMVLMEAARRLQKDVVRSRETGAYDNRKLWGSVDTTVMVVFGRFAIDAAPVTNAQFREFLKASAYAPRFTENFLKHWTDGNLAAGTESDPVVYVDIGDARAYARWAGKRLPAEDEWQYAIESGQARYGAVRVWEWNDNEWSDGRVRFGILKGGCDWISKGSIFYAPGGPQEPSFSAKYLFMWPGLDRLKTVGFRCAVDVE